MNKKLFLILALLLIIGCPVTFSADTTPSLGLDKNTIYYPHANLKSAVAKYKSGNYSGCLQELFSLTKKNPSNAAAYYYMALAFTHVDMKDEAIAAYEKVISLSSDSALVDYATKGRDCLTGGPACISETAQKAGTDEVDKNVTPSEDDKLDKFINSPYGSGLSPELEKELKQKELNNFQKTINQKQKLEIEDIEKLKKFDELNKSEAEPIKIAQVSDDDILNAVKTLKEAGLNVTVQSSENPYAYQTPEMLEMSMLLGNSGNNTMNNMLPMLMSKAQSGENIDPRFMQAIMMNSMLPDFTFNNNDNNNRY